MTAPVESFRDDSLAEKAESLHDVGLRVQYSVISDVDGHDRHGAEEYLRRIHARNGRALDTGGITPRTNRQDGTTLRNHETGKESIERSSVLWVNLAA
ncbi:MAG: hypothetical protein JOZ81_22650 [Chloroflexi bacterium]|nr:hypothetical protein [Chloroflexota bacterium]